MSLSPKYVFAGVGALTCLTVSAFFFSAQYAKKQVTTAQTTHVQPMQNDSVREKVFNAQSYMLENGLQLVVIENKRVPVITHMAWYRVGAADEPRGKSGIAHFLEHLMFKGHESEALGHYAAGEFSKVIRGLGGRDNAFTSQDYTAYFQSIASEHLEKVMRMEAGRMRGMNPPIDDVVSENKVIQEERRQRTDNNPRAKMAEQLREALFPNHPYAIPVIGWVHEIEALQWDEIKAFYDIYYAPNNAIVVVSGDVDAEDVYKIAQETYGLAKAEDVPKRIRTQSPPFIASTRVTLEHETIKQPTYQRIYRVPSHRQNPQKALALQVLEEIMAGGSSSRLYKKLVVESKTATDVSLSYSPNSWDDSTLSISVVAPTANALEKSQAILDQVLTTLIDGGITDQELTDAVQRMQADAVFALDSVSGPAMIVGYNLITGATLDDIEYWPYRIETVTKEQVQDVAQTYLNPQKPHQHPPVEGVLLPPNNDSQTINASEGE